MTTQQIQSHYDNTVGTFINDVFVVHPQASKLQYPRHLAVAVDFSASFRSNITVPNDLRLEINICYGYIAPDLIKDFKKVMNNYLKPLFNGEGVTHWLNCRAQRTNIYSVAANSSILDPVKPCALNILNKNLETGLRVLIDAQK